MATSGDTCRTLVLAMSKLLTLQVVLLRSAKIACLPVKTVPSAKVSTASSVQPSLYALTSWSAYACHPFFSSATISSLRSAAIDGETTASANSIATMDDFIATPLLVMYLEGGSPV